MIQRLDVLDLIIQLLKDQEERLNDLTHRFDAIADCIEKLTFRLEEVAIFWENHDTKGDAYHE